MIHEIVDRIIKRRTILLTSLLIGMILCASFAGYISGQEKPAFTKDNRDSVVYYLMQKLSAQTGAKTSAADAGSSIQTSDKDFTGKFISKNPDGTVETNLAARFIALAKKEAWGRSEFREIKIGNLKGFMVETPGVMSEGSRGSPDTSWYRVQLPLQQAGAL